MDRAFGPGHRPGNARGVRRLRDVYRPAFPARNERVDEDAADTLAAPTDAPTTPVAGSAGGSVPKAIAAPARAQLRPVATISADAASEDPEPIGKEASRDPRWAGRPVPDADGRRASWPPRDDEPRFGSKDRHGSHPGAGRPRRRSCRSGAETAAVARAAPTPRIGESRRDRSLDAAAAPRRHNSPGPDIWPPVPGFRRGWCRSGRARAYRPRRSAPDRTRRPAQRSGAHVVLGARART